MSRPRSNTRLISLLLPMVLISLACNTLSGGAPAASTPYPVSMKKDVVYGSGTFNLPSTSAGLSELSSYVATLILSFDGTRDGQPAKWSVTYEMSAQKDPAARQLTIERSGDLTELDPVLMAEEGETGFERIGENSCSASLVETGNSLSDRMEPAGLLNYVLGADEAGSESVNDIAADHYTFDQRALGQQGVTESKGEMWIAPEGGYVVKYLLTMTGKSDYFGEGIEGTLNLDYELTDVNQPVEILLPADCPPGLVQAPQLPDASNIVSNLGSFSYQASSTVPDAAAFYQKELPNVGWQPVGEPGISDKTALLAFAKAGQSMSVMITAEATATTIQIVLLRTQE